MFLSFETQSRGPPKRSRGTRQEKRTRCGGGGEGLCYAARMRIRFVPDSISAGFGDAPWPGIDNPDPPVFRIKCGLNQLAPGTPVADYEKLLSAIREKIPGAAIRQPEMVEVIGPDGERTLWPADWKDRQHCGRE